MSSTCKYSTSNQSFLSVSVSSSLSLSLLPAAYNRLMRGRTTIIQQQITIVECNLQNVRVNYMQLTQKNYNNYSTHCVHIQYM